MVAIRQLRTGEIIVQPWQPSGGGWVPVETPGSAVADGDAVVVARAAREALTGMPTSRAAPGGETAAPFGFKDAWLAVRGSTPERVADALGLTGQRRLPWHEGVAAASEGGIFVSPPTSGWVLAVGVDWLGSEPDVTALSDQLGTEVQYFATHRVIEGTCGSAPSAGGSFGGWSLNPLLLVTTHTSAEHGIHGQLPAA